MSFPQMLVTLCHPLKMHFGTGHRRPQEVHSERRSTDNHRLNQMWPPLLTTQALSDRRVTPVCRRAKIPTRLSSKLTGITLP